MPLTDVQKETLSVIHDVFGDSREDYQSALEDLILEAGPGPVRRFLAAEIRGLSARDFPDPQTYYRAKRLIKTLLKAEKAQEGGHQQ